MDELKLCRLLQLIFSTYYQMLEAFFYLGKNINIR